MGFKQLIRRAFLARSAAHSSRSGIEPRTRRGSRPWPAGALASTVTGSACGIEAHHLNGSSETGGDLRSRPCRAGFRFWGLVSSSVNGTPVRRIVSGTAEDNPTHALGKTTGIICSAIFMDPLLCPLAAEA